MMKRNLIALALLCILGMAFLVMPVTAGLTIVDGATISTADGATSPVITITDAPIAQDDTITIDVADLHQTVDSLTFTTDNVVVSDTAAAATWTGEVVGDTLTLTSTGGPTAVDETVTVTFTGENNIWYLDFGGGSKWEFVLTATRTDGNGAGTFNFVIDPALTFSSAATNTAGTKVLVTFNKYVADPPPAAPDGFTVTVGVDDNVVSEVALNTADHKIIELTLTNPVLVKTDVVTVTYAPGTVTAEDTGVLAAFGPSAVTNNVVPIVTGIAPSSGIEAGGTVVTVTGTGFTGATAVNFGAKLGTALAVNPEGTQITITSPDGAAGAVVDVTVTTTAGGTSATGAADQFTYDPAPIVTNINPKTGINTGSVSFTIDGTDFVNGAGLTVSLRRAGYADIDATNVVWVNPTRITCDFDITGETTGDWNIIVRNPDGQNSLAGANNLFQMIGLVVANAVSNQPSDNSVASAGTGGSPGAGAGQSAAPASVEKPEAPGLTGPASPADPGQTATIYANPNGVITQATTLKSTDGLATLTVGLGVVATDPAGTPLSSVSVAAMPAESVPSLHSGTAVSFAGIAYELGPNGAQFSPAISITFTAPPGQVGQDYTVRSYDHVTGTWQDLPTSYDPQTGTVTAEVSHFCCFALFTKTVTTAPAIAAIPAIPAPTPLIPTTIAPPSPTIATTFMGIILWVVNLMITNPMVLAGIVILAVGIVLIVWKQRRDRLNYRP